MRLLLGAGLSRADGNSGEIRSYDYCAMWAGFIISPVYIHVMALREFRFSRNYVNGFVHVMHYVNSIFHVMVSDGLAAAV